MKVDVTLRPREREQLCRLFFAGSSTRSLARLFRARPSEVEQVLRLDGRRVARQLVREGKL